MALESTVLPRDLQNKVNSCRLLVVGAGGIGCELLKNLVLTGFKSIDLIDLDIIDVSNLNRQFLFRKEHVGKSKAQVAKESALRFNRNVNITARHDTIMSPDYGTDYFKQFTMVLNALDNRAARNHVNRMCLAADVPLVESGTAGYLGQVTVIKKGLTECYECQPKPRQKTFPGCTIRNTPSEPIHCIVWAKHLFNQLFGEADPDEDVSPDTEDPELAGEAGEQALQSEAKDDIAGGIERKSTRVWAMDTAYNAEKIFNKLFRDDIKYLLSMANLWKKRRPPNAVDYNEVKVSGDTNDGNSDSTLLHDQRVWSLKENLQVFEDSVDRLKSQLKQRGDDDSLVWDKDDQHSMDFVTAAANIRAHVFGIPLKSRFEVKSMAGNIIPAIATTNAVIAGLIVVEALKILRGEIESCNTVYLNKQPNYKKRLIVPCMLEKPNPKCYVCSTKPEVSVKLNTEHITVKTLEEKILKGYFGMVAPDVEVDDGLGTILISSEEGETDENAEGFLSDFGIKNGSRLKCDDFLQHYELVLTVELVEKLEDDVEFLVLGSVEDIMAQQTATKDNDNGAGTSSSADTETAGGYGTTSATNGNTKLSQDSTSDLEIIDDDEEENEVTRDRVAKKRKLQTSGDESVNILKKKAKTDQLTNDEEIVIL